MATAAARRREIQAEHAGSPPVARRRFNWRLALALALNAAFWSGVAWVALLYI